MIIIFLDSLSLKFQNFSQLNFIQILLVFIFSINFSLAQEDFYNEDYVYLENIKSAKFFAGNNALNYPISNIMGSTPLYLKFDDIEGDSKDYFYKIVHCDMDWNISNLDESDYLEGFNGEEIKNKNNSSFTLLQYTHYSLKLPNENTKWLLSGNYLLVVYDGDENIAITKRFLVAENKVKIYASMDHSKDVTKFRTSQSLDITLNNKDYRIVDPLKELKVTVLQNDKWIDAKKNVSPKYLLGDEIRFDAFDPFVFSALNEFRYFDTRSLYATNIEIRSIDISRNGVNVILENDVIRKYSNYFFHKDINGNYLILNNDNSNGSISGQYTNVFFTLETNAPLKDHDVYVIGSFCDWQLYEENKLDYDEELLAYTGSILFKQGVFDYYYATVDKENNIDLSSMEGSLFETQNDYTILVYHRPFGGRYDKLVGVQVIE